MSKYQSGNGMFIMQRFNNKKGAFISVAEFKGGVIGGSIVVQLGRFDEGWEGVANAIEEASSRSYASQQRTEEKKTQVKQGGLDMNSHKNGERTRMEAFQTKDMDYSKLVVCIRDCLWHKWSSIQASINQHHSTEFCLQPFQPDKAIFCCKTEQEAEEFGSKEVLFFEGPKSIMLHKWNPNEVNFNKKVAFTGGWVELEDLPFHLWRSDIFRKIGDICGGMEEVHSLTMEAKRLFAPRIRARGNYNGFIPGELVIVDDEEKEFTIQKERVSAHLTEHNRSGLHIGGFHIGVNSDLREELPIGGLHFGVNSNMGEDTNGEGGDMNGFNSEARLENGLWANGQSIRREEKDLINGEQVGLLKKAKEIMVNGDWVSQRETDPEIADEEEWVTVKPKLRGKKKRRKSNLAKRKWAQKAILVYSRHNKKAACSLKAGEEIADLKQESRSEEEIHSDSDSASVKGLVRNPSFDQFEEDAVCLPKLFHKDNTKGRIHQVVTRREHIPQSQWNYKVIDSVCMFGNMFTILFEDIKASWSLNKAALVLSNGRHLEGNTEGEVSADSHHKSAISAVSEFIEEKRIINHIITDNTQGVVRRDLVGVRHF
ncbi:hypothetical protein LguiA_017596 [Lonicera macranthoides]